MQQEKEMNDLMKSLAKSNDPEKVEKGKIELEKEVDTTIAELGKPTPKAKEELDKMGVEVSCLNARESVIGFVAWLTTRSITATFGAKHGSAEPCDLANHFCNVNNLPDCRDDWTENLTHPEN